MRAPTRLVVTWGLTAFAVALGDGPGEGRADDIAFSIPFASVTLGAGVHQVDFALPAPVSLADASGVLVDALSRTYRLDGTPNGIGTPYLHGEHVASVQFLAGAVPVGPEVEFWRIVSDGPPVACTMRNRAMAFGDFGPPGATLPAATAVRLNVSNLYFAQGYAVVEMTTELAPMLADSLTIRLARGPWNGPNPHATRIVSELAPTSAVAGTATPWQVFAIDPPVAARNLAWIAHGPIPLSGAIATAGSRIESELVLCDGTVLRLDTVSAPPPIGPPVVNGLHANDASFAVPPELRLALDGLEVVSWRWRGVVGGAGAITWTPPAELTLVFARAAPDGGTNGDLDRDGVVDAADVARLLRSWGPCDVCEACAADLNDDGIVDFDDLLLILSWWT